jgi:hypothetical protein
MADIVQTTLTELRAHAPFTALGTLAGIFLILIMAGSEIPREVSVNLFGTFHPLHVFLSAIVTAGMYRLHGEGRFGPMILIGYFGSIGIGSFSDCVIPWIGELLLELPNRGLHLGFIEKWWLVNPLAFAGIAFAFWKPSTKFPHAGHVLLSTLASLFHITMALGHKIDFLTAVIIGIFLFLAVWIPCCSSDIIFPLLFKKKEMS